MLFTCGRRIVASLTAAAAALISVHAQNSPGSSGPPALTIVSPAEDSYLNGEITLRAGLEPSDVASAVVFFVDGRQVCVVPQAPFECEWDAGRT
jgi:hypothetical protein